MNIEDVREAIREKLSAIDGVQTSAYVLGNPTPPTIQVFPGPANHNTSFHGPDRHEDRTFVIQVIAGLGTDIGAQKNLDRLISEDAIWTALQVEDPDDPWDDINVVSDSGYTRFEKDGSAPLLGVEYTVRVIG